ncbi:MAG: hypothetical protein QXX36_01390 [Candidatus Rehaiarchaeum fermentans]|nr:hypothetical protein [Candidatus Rehaiarchaeum fermentans]MCW1297239.1 hypothetical protein [Candidatus Rehaiarchaeum fermentans]MCW1302261.1 hypothetical protein [Candidatus Rehaiarchaeum fermentans]
MIFGKKKDEETATNPYFNPNAVNSALSNKDQQAQTENTQQNTGIILPTPLMPPPPTAAPKVLESTEKPYFFVKVTEFREILNNLEEIYNHVQNLRSSTLELAKAIEEENEAIKKYVVAQDNLKKAIDEIKSILSQPS